jgi:hypothetical protein
VRTQWREGFNGRTGLDYGPVIEIIRALGWDLLATLDLLQAIELEVLKTDGADE